MGKRSVNFMTEEGAKQVDWKIAGNGRALDALGADFASGDLVHAYLLSGPAGVGKFTAAMRLAQMVQCEQNGCSQCNVCSEIAKGYHGDTIVVRDAGEAVKIAETRKIIDTVFMSRQAPYKVVVLQNVERMTTEASNALLKTLEDPPERTLFLLTTDRVQDLLATIISRVRMVRFDKLGDEEFDKFIAEKFGELDSEKLGAVRFFAQGLPGAATRLLEDEARLESLMRLKKEVLELVEKDDLTARMSYVADVISQMKTDKDDDVLTDFLLTLQLAIREKMLKKASAGELEACKSMLETLHKGLEVNKLLERNVNKRMLLESLMFTL